MVATALFAIIIPLGVYLAYAPVRDTVTSASPDAASLVAAHEDTARTAIVLVVIALVAVRLVRLGWRMLALRSHRYGVSNQRITVESGVFSSSLAEVDVRTIDDITFHQSFVERLMGIGEVAIRSSDAANPRLAACASWASPIRAMFASSFAAPPTKRPAASSSREVPKSPGRRPPACPDHSTGVIQPCGSAARPYWMSVMAS